jgi:hypothetical protein
MYWHWRNLKYKFRHAIRWPKYAYQRVTRGFSDRDMWNADSHFARLYADMLMWYVHKGMSIPSRFVDNWTDHVEVAAERRDIEYYKYADIFRRYAKGGEWQVAEHAHESGGVLDTEMAEALEWFSKHFQEFWD